MPLDSYTSLAICCLAMVLASHGGTSPPNGPNKFRPVIIGGPPPSVFENEKLATKEGFKPTTPGMSAFDTSNTESPTSLKPTTQFLDTKTTESPTSQNPTTQPLDTTTTELLTSQKPTTQSLDTTMTESLTSQKPTTQSLDTTMTESLTSQKPTTQSLDTTTPESQRSQNPTTQPLYGTTTDQTGSNTTRQAVDVKNTTVIEFQPVTTTADYVSEKSIKNKTIESEKTPAGGSNVTAYQRTKCKVLLNGTKLCHFSCQGVQLECLNGGRCVLDDNLVPVCKCPRSESGVYTGPHCEHLLAQTAALKDSKSDLLFTLLCVAGAVIVCLVVLLFVGLAVYKHRHRKWARLTKIAERLARDAEMQNYDLDSHRTDYDSVRLKPLPAESNRLYFVTPTAVENEYFECKEAAEMDAVYSVPKSNRHVGEQVSSPPL